MNLDGFIRALQAGHRPEANRALNGLVGCPAGGWGETQQAWSRLADALPRRTERGWKVADLVDRVLCLDHADRYQWRD